MAKYKPYNYSQSVLLPVYLDAQLMPGTLEFAIHTLMMDAQIAADKKAEEGFDRIDRDKQIERLQKQAERIEKWLSQNEPKIGKSDKELKSNITDNDPAK